MVMLKIASISLWFFTTNGSPVELVNYQVHESSLSATRFSPEDAEEACKKTKNYINQQRIDAGYTSQLHLLNCVPKYVPDEW